MTKLWFKTNINKIVDLHVFFSFVITDNYPNLKKGQWILSACSYNDKISELGLFDTKEEAQAYLDEIYKLLTGEND